MFLSFVSLFYTPSPRNMQRLLIPVPAKSMPHAQNVSSSGSPQNLSCAGSSGWPALKSHVCHLVVNMPEKCSLNPTVGRWHSECGDLANMEGIFKRFGGNLKWQSALPPRFNHTLFSY